MLVVQAGAKAYEIIRKHGLSPELFRGMIGASGGPKWFSLYGLDRYLATEFWPRILHPVVTFGSSAGAWRMACHAASTPEKALTRLADHYAHETYSRRADREEITKKAEQMLHRCLSDSDREAIVSNPKFSTHIFAVRCHGNLASENKIRQGLGLLTTAAANTIHRRLLKSTCTRAVFYTGTRNHFPTDGLPTCAISLNKDNLKKALLASGAIPFALYGQRNIPGAPSGCYRDGGLIDYHFDAPFNQLDGLLLYPHFYSHLTPGWFDKLLKRRPHTAWFENVVLLSPSSDFVDRLPFRKIPDRKDFTRLDAKVRIQYWERVLKESERLAEAFDDIIHKGPSKKVLRPLPG